MSLKVPAADGRLSRQAANSTVRYYKGRIRLFLALPFWHPFRHYPVSGSVSFRAPPATYILVFGQSPSMLGKCSSPTEYVALKVMDGLSKL